MTPSGIEPVTFRFVAQKLNHCATAVPKYVYIPFVFQIKNHLLFILIININLLTLLHISTIKVLSSESTTSTFQRQAQNIELPNIKFNLVSSVEFYIW
jgi:hypothetical protein